MASRILRDPITVVPDGDFRAKFVLRWMSCSRRMNRASEIHYDLEITSPMPGGQRYCVRDRWLTINRLEPRLYDELIEIFGNEIDGLLDEDDKVDMDLLIGKEVNITVDSYVNTRGSIGPRHWFRVSCVKSIRRVKPAQKARKQSPATRSSVSRKSTSVALHRDAFAKMYLGIAAL